MSELDEAMAVHMAYIVLSEGRPFSYVDFLQFKVDGKEYGMNHGTYRNKILALKRSGEVELDYNSGIAFHTLKGHRFGKPMTPNHTVVHNNPFLKFLESLPFDKQSIHDIHLKFKAPQTWKRFSVNPSFHRKARSQDIIIPSWGRENAILKVTIHRTDVVSVVVGCSLRPIPLDVGGILRFFSLLVRIEERLASSLDSSCHVSSGETTILIPDYGQWIVTMWHFGRDGLTEYTGEKFSITVEKAQHILTRIYSKEFGRHTRIRDETQEYPRKALADAIEEKLYGVTN